MHQRSNGERAPDVVVTARWLAYLLARLSLPLDVYAVSAGSGRKTSRNPQLS
jgi:hypothetical protein